MVDTNKGSYHLIIYLSKSRWITIGKLGKFRFPKGYYIYTGSAMNSLSARIDRHLKKKKRLFWHIDFLLKYGKILKVRENVSKTRRECQENLKVGRLFGAIILHKKFGSSDCNCQTHLFFFPQKQFIQKLLNK